MRIPAGQTNLRTHQVSGVFHQFRPREDNLCETLKSAEIIIKIHRQTSQQKYQTRNAHAQGNDAALSLVVVSTSSTQFLSDDQSACATYWTQRREPALDRDYV